MSATSHPDASFPASSHRGAVVRNLLREPLLHFVVLGAALFAVDFFIVSRAEDPHRIVITAEIDNEAKQLFSSARGRAPNADELKALRERWIDNEVLYREGLALRVDQGDAAIRERVIFKSLSVIEAGLKLPAYDDTTLRNWFESKRAKYDEPARYDFQEAVISEDSSEAAVRAFVDALNAGTPGDTKAGLRVFKGRPRENLLQSYGIEFVKALDEAPSGTWRVLPSQGGARAIRLDSIAPARPADFESLRGVVLHDWTDASMADQRTAAVRNLGRKYTVTIEAAGK